MKRIIFIVVLIHITNCTQTRKQAEKLSANPVDTVCYAYKKTGVGMKLKLMSNLKFAYYEKLRGCTGGGYFKNVFGTYKIDTHHLLLFPDSVSYFYFPFNSHQISLCLQSKYNEKNDSLRIKTKYNMIPYGNSEYLVSAQNNYLFNFRSFSDSTDYLMFAENYNANNSNFHLIMSRKLLRKDSSRILDINLIPQKFRYLFLKKPIVAKIIKVKKKRYYYDYQSADNDKENWYYVYTVTINKGKKDGVYVGLTFYQTPEVNMQITKVNEHTSVGKTTYLLNVKLNNKLTTKNYKNAN